MKIPNDLKGKIDYLKSLPSKTKDNLKPRKGFISSELEGIVYEDENYMISANMNRSFYYVYYNICNCAPEMKFVVIHRDNKERQEICAWCKNKPEETGKIWKVFKKNVIIYENGAKIGSYPRKYGK